jgi:hypothetical protein
MASGGPGTKRTNKQGAEQENVLFLPNHKAWCLHNQTDCTLGSSPQPKTSGEDKRERSGKPKLSLTTVLQTLIDNTGGYSDDESEDSEEE